MRIAVLHNPAAGEALSRRQLEKLLRQHGHECLYHSSKEDGGEQIVCENADLVLAAGGDGTVAKAMKLIGSRLPLVVLPVGTANNLALSIGVHGTYEEIVGNLRQAEPRTVSIAAARGPWGETPFVESAGVGLFASRLRAGKSQTGFPRRDDPELDPIGWGRHRLRGLLDRMAPRFYRIEVDGVDCSGQYLMAAAMNIPYIGPRLGLAPQARLDDERLDLVLIRDDERVEFASWLDHQVQGAVARFPIPGVKGKVIRIEWSGASGHLDDELWPDPEEVEQAGGPVTLEIGREGVRVLV
jgi:diacylglycerol kinase family enzyme